MQSLAEQPVWQADKETFDHWCMGPNAATRYAIENDARRRPRKGASLEASGKLGGNAVSRDAQPLTGWALEAANWTKDRAGTSWGTIPIALNVDIGYKACGLKQLTEILD